uniref:LPS-assembly lipoprotein LptE n=1 Tax=Candidatus Kentrum eta TaxID=2126337 RepID=A0A450V0M6_9GAMM|nr:MAG: LPS-assembly lipoprotein [Candidatus Kentron sp. H]VFJ98724.1 MAG: LPS-assembly lipoprotein [Candidatus Kentron sp. H]VFK03961.1 MAG: LPS-assembly lipoprotein [Candidatus Kentron sp. H]
MDKSIKTTFLFPLIGILTAGLLAGCGFHLRGDMSLPEGISSLQVQGPTHLVDELVMLLESNNITITSDRPDAILAIEQERFGKHTLSVESKTGKEREHELTYTVAYRVLSADGKELLPQQTVKLVRDYVFDESAVLGARRERTLLHQEMCRDAANQIIRRLAIWRP